MSTTTSTKVTTDTQQIEKAVSYAALILADANVSITTEKLQALLKAANIDDIEPIWTTLFAKALKGKDLQNILTTLPTCSLAVGPKSYTRDEPDTDHEEAGEITIDSEKEGDQCDSDSEEGMFDLFG